MKGINWAMKTKSKNYYIELLRFIFCMVIVLHHSGFVSKDGLGLFPSGGVIADAFFMLTGYFACSHIARMQSLPEKKMKYSIKYTLDKLVKVLPYAAFGVVISYLLEIIHMTEWSFGDLFEKLASMIGEILLFPMVGILKTDLVHFRNAPLWFLSAMLVALPILMYLAMRYEDVFTNYIIWFAPLFIEGWMVRTYGGALPWMDYHLLVCSGAIRGFASMMIGFAIYHASIKLSEMNINKALASIAELITLVIIALNIFRGVNGYDEVATILLIAVMLTLALSEKTITSDIQISLFGYLGKISLPVYCIHWGIYKWVSAYLGGLSYALAVVVTIAVSVIASVILMMLVEHRGKR